MMVHRHRWNGAWWPQRGGNRQVSRRIRRPPSQRTGNEMAVGISIIVLEFYIPEVRSLVTVKGTGG